MLDCLCFKVPVYDFIQIIFLHKGNREANLDSWIIQSLGTHVECESAHVNNDYSTHRLSVHSEYTASQQSKIVIRLVGPVQVLVIFSIEEVEVFPVSEDDSVANTHNSSCPCEMEEIITY